MWNLFGKEDGPPYKITDIGVKLDFSFCWVHSGTHMTRGGRYSIFESAISNADSREYSCLNIQRLRTLRHPNVLSYVYDSEEARKITSITLVTENVTPLLQYLGNMTFSGIKNEYIALGILKILKALIFCHETAKLLHNNVGCNAVFVDRAGEWKLAEFGVSNESYCGPVTGTRAEQYHKWIKNNSKVTWELDTYGIAVLALEAFEGRIHSDPALPDPSQKVPPGFRKAIKSILDGDCIPTLPQLLAEGTATQGCFRNEFIDKISFLEEIHSKTKDERSRFYTDFHVYLRSLPGNIKKFKIFPLIMLSYNYGCEGSDLLPSVLEFCQMKDPEVDLVPIIGRLYNSPSRKTRNSLLDNMSKYITVLAPSVINETIYPMWEVGFQDNSEIIRLETLKSTKQIVTVLNPQRINRRLLPRLVKLLVDEVRGDIREMALNSVLEIVEAHADSAHRNQLFLTILLKALNDTHPPTKCAAINNVVKLQDNFTQHIIATKLLPPLCLLTTDINARIKDSAINAIRALLLKIENSEPEEVFPVCPKPSDSWAEWAKNKLSSKISSIFLEDEQPQQANLNNNVNNLGRGNAPRTEGDSAKTTEKRATSITEEGVNKNVRSDQNQYCENISEREGDEPNEPTNNTKQEGTDENNQTRRKLKKLKSPTKLGTRINQRK